MKSRIVASLSLWGCVAVLMAGCSTFGSNQPTAVGSSRSGPSDKTAVQAAADPQDSETRTPKWELPIPNHPSIENWVKRFAEEKHRSFQTQLMRANNYTVPAHEVFEQRGLPKDLIFVALVESGFSPKARSHAKAVGMWQFIPTTGKRFGLEQNRWIDERCHPLKAARAAADYLSFLFDTFGSWPLALAAYNAGEKAVQGALDQSGRKTFWELAENGYLPAETRDYVPKVFAAVKIIRNPRDYGFYFDPGHYAPRHETVPIPGNVKLSWIEKQIGVPETSLQDCNPELCRPVTPPCSNYELCVPIGKGDEVLAAVAKLPWQAEEAPRKATANKSDSVASYKVKPGDSWSGLAAKHRCSAQALAALNSTNPARPLKAGQTLKVPAGKSAQALAALNSTNPARPLKTGQTSKVPAGKSSKAVAAAQTKDSKGKLVTLAKGNGKASDSRLKPHQPMSYPVRKGDTLSSIADRYHIPLKTLCAQNKVSANQKLVPGDRLTIYSR